ncbi:MAG: T9SS type A sorting domain-containing protein [Bacteroidetes bacterium]|nr:T9SS type A sorting domain-containing protein [Bacteroidota bacterium]
MSRLLPLLIGILLWTALPASLLDAQTFVGSERCKACHNTMNQTVGYNIWEEYSKTGHPYKLNLINGAQPEYPANTSPGVPDPPPGTTWNDFVYVIGGYGWKARFIRPNGDVYVETDQAQFNIATKGWVPYNKDKHTPYSFSCFKCHTTGATPEGSWSAVTSDLGNFSEPGIRCEGCHGPGSEHVANPASVKLPNQGRDLTYERCGDCHQRGGKTNAVPAGGGFVQHHEQFNEMQASKHKNMTCNTCHDVHIPLLYPEAAGAGLKAIRMECSSCHPNKQITIDGKVKEISCQSCHMAKTGKSAVGKAVGNGWMGDISSHVWKIRTDAVTRTEMFTSDGALLALDVNGLASTTLDFACLGCHQQQTVEWAAGYAENIHDGITTDLKSIASRPTTVTLEQNYPNPFNPGTLISYYVPKTSAVRLDVYDALGKPVVTLVEGEREAGPHTVEFTARDLVSGVYFYRITVGETVITRKMMLMK